MNPEKINNQDSILGAAMKIAQGNPGALGVVCELIKVKPVEGAVALCHMDDMNIRGSKVWVGFKDYCKQDLNKFFELIMSRDEAMQKFIKESEY